MMKVATFEGVVENGQIRLETNVCLPDKTKVYVVVPDFEGKEGYHFYSPHLVDPEQAKDFEMKIVETLPDADL